MMSLILGVAMLTGVSNALADPAVVCTGTANSHSVKIIQGFNATIDGIGYSPSQLTILVDAVEVTRDRLPYSQATTFYVSPDRDITTMMLLNDGQQSLLTVEYLGEGQLLNRVQVSNNLIDKNAPSDLLSLTSATCKTTRH